MDLKQLFHAAFEKRRDASANRDPIIRLLMPSFITIMLSVACFMTASWAWFVANHSYEVTSIQSGYFEAGSVTVKSGETDEPVTTGAKGVWTFDATAAQEYSVSMTVKGNVDGHFKVTVPVAGDNGSVNDTVSYPFSLTPGEDGVDVKFHVCTNAGGSVKIEVNWGEPTSATSWQTVKDQYENGTLKFGNGNPVSATSDDPTNESGEGTGSGGESSQNGPDDPPANDDPAGSNEETGTQSAETE